MADKPYPIRGLGDWWNELRQYINDRPTRGSLPEVNVRDYGAAGNGVSDDTAKINAAAVAAKASGAALYVPQGEYLIAGTVDLEVGVRCEGTFIVPTDSPTAGLRWPRTTAGTAVPAASLGGLTEGSTKITGAPSAGTYILTSTEVLINRNNGSGSAPYYKTEVVSVSSDGTLGSPLAHTYTDLGALSVTYHEPDPPIEVIGLRVSCRGSSFTLSPFVVATLRDNATFKDLSITNTTANKMSVGLYIRLSVGTLVDGLEVTGFDRISDGYGVLDSVSSGTTLRRVNITRCRHPFTGRNHKDFSVEGGTVQGEGSDSHWVTRMSVRGLRSYTPTEMAHFAVAGKDVIIEGGEYYGGRSILSVRGDTPELAGSLVIAGFDWKPDSRSALWAVGYAGISNLGDGFDYGRTVRSPSQVKIQNGTVTLKAGTGSLHLLWANNGTISFPVEWWNNISIEDVAVFGAQNATLVAAYQGDVKKSIHADPGPVNISIARVYMGGTGDTVNVGNTGDAADPALTNLMVTNCTGTAAIKLPDVGVGAVRVTGTRIKSLLRSATATSHTPVYGDMVVRDSEFASTTFSGNLSFDVVNCVWSGTITASQATVDNRLKSVDGNRVRVGTTGAPTRANGYRNPTFYSA